MTEVKTPTDVSSSGRISLSRGIVEGVDVRVLSDEEDITD
jgi:hypothetical protein